LSRIFKSSRVILDDKAFVLSTKIEQTVPTVESDELAANDVIDHTLAANQVIEEARTEAESILNEADREAEEKLNSANVSSEKIIADAYDQAKGIMEQARKQGYEEGYEFAITESRDIADGIVSEANALKHEWLRAKESLEKEAESELVEIVLTTLEKILNRKVEEESTVVEGIIAEAIKRVNKTENLTLRVSSEDYSHVLSIKPMILAMTEKVDEIEIKQDSSLKNGSCVIDTDSGSIDSSVWTQFEQVRKVFEDLLRSE